MPGLTTRRLGLGIGIGLAGVVAARRLAGTDRNEGATAETDDRSGGADVATDDAAATEPSVSVAGPPATEFVYSVVNPIVSLLLRSPLHGLASDDLALITFTGRVSGKEYTTPVGYHELDDGRTLVLTHSDWWKNLRGGEPVTLRVRGEDREAVATPESDPEVVADDLRALAEHVGPGNLRRLGLDYDGEGVPSRAALREAAEETVILEVEFREERAETGAA
jgi:hypothetical protein